MNKTTKAREAYLAADYKMAFKLASTFRLGVTKEDKAAITRGYEALVHPEFYRQLGKDLDSLVAQAKVAFVRVVPIA